MLKFLVDSYKNFVRPVMINGKGGKLGNVGDPWWDMGGSWGIDADLDNEEVEELGSLLLEREEDEKEDSDRDEDGDEDEDEDEDDNDNDPQERAFLFCELFSSLRSLWPSFPPSLLPFIEKKIDKNFDLLLCHFSSLMKEGFFSMGFWFLPQ